MILTSSVPIVCKALSISQAASPRYGQRAVPKTHVDRVFGLQHHCPVEQLLQDGEHAVSSQAALKAGQKLQVQLHISPGAFLDARLQCWGYAAKYLVD
jgi:hypothetical protein